MPKIGEFRTRQYCNGGHAKQIWVACEMCGKERWVFFVKGKPISILCGSCWQKGKNNPNWRDRWQLLTREGYRFVKVSINDFFYPMANMGRTTTGGYVGEHRLVMAKHIGRCLHSWEGVHHRNSIRTDNRIENLQLVLSGTHKGDIKCPFCQKTFGIK